MRTTHLLLALVSVAASVGGPRAAWADGPGGRPPGPLSGPVVGSEVPAGERRAIAWFGTLEGARAEAARSGRPIFLLSAAPQCHGISGLW